MVIISRNEYIWIIPEKESEYSVPVGARVKSAEGSRYLVQDDEGQEYYVGPNRKIRVMHSTSVQGVEDMISLGDLHEAGILRNLLIRYQEGFIYTYTGSILVAVNPYEVLPVYTPEHVKMYRKKKIGELPPHIFAIADNAYSSLFRVGNQCIIISGESGAGKTESTKIVLQFLAAISGQHSWIEQQILESNPILEAFGNAKTIRNDNSSRFGKYIDIQFNKTGSIEGAKIEQYLLEKSRIVHQAQDERNYHVFYCMLAGMSEDEKRKLYLSKPSNYFYLTQGGGSLVCEGRQDSAEYLNILSAMKVLLFGEDEIYNIFQLLAIILHLGNLNYKGTTIKNLDASEIANPSTLEPLAKLLMVKPSDLNRALTTKTLITGGETVISTLGAERSMDVRDAFCKGIYGKLFVWIVEKINCAIKAPHHNDNSSGKINPDMSSTYFFSNHNSKTNLTNGYNGTICRNGINEDSSNLGVLDIFGFENFHFNSFEQFCINYANENLQQFFIRHIFKLEQEEYNSEGINWQHIDFVDNQETLDLIAGKPLHLVSLIDEESRFPKGTDITLLDKLNHTHASHNSYIKTRGHASAKHFGINHFAGRVYYDIRGFIEKNRDTFSADLLSLIYSTNNKFLHSLFQKEKMLGPETRKKSPTLGLQFKRSLDLLMKTLETCQPFFIRCVKPNDDKKPGIFDRQLVIKQLRYSGMMETIRIRRNGYPIRHAFVDFYDRYKHSIPVYVLRSAGITIYNNSKDKTRNTKLIESQIDFRKAVNIICSNVLGNKADFQIGHAKVFLKDCHDLFLEQARERALTQKIILIQKGVRGWIARRRYINTLRATLVIQKYWKGRLERRKFLTMLIGFSRLEALIKARRLRNEFLATQHFMINLQALCRGFLVRKETRIKIEAALKNPQKFRKDNHDNKDNNKYNCNNNKTNAKFNSQSTNSTMDEQATIEELFGDLDLEAEDDSESFNNGANGKIKGINDIKHIGSNKKLVGRSGDESSMAAPTAFKDLEVSRQKALLNHKKQQETHSDEIFCEDFDLNSFDEAELSEYKFIKFATTYFRGNVTHSFIKGELKQPLLPHKNPGDILAALDVWIMILRFMGDLPEPNDNVVNPTYSRQFSNHKNAKLSSHSNNGIRDDNTSVMNKIYTTLSRTAGKSIAADKAFSNNASNDNGINHNNQYNNNHKPIGHPRETLRKKLISLTLKRKSKMPVDLMMRQDNGRKEDFKRSDPNGYCVNDNSTKQGTNGLNFANDEEDTSGYFCIDPSNPVASLKHKPMSNLDKLHFIIGNGILRPRIRDELFCQICKQLTGNPHPDTSKVRGWILLSLCLGCFPPSPTFEKYLRNFLHQNKQSEHKLELPVNNLLANNSKRAVSIDFASRCLHRLKRTLKNGARTQPPSWLELQAAKASVAAVYNAKRINGKEDPRRWLSEREPPIMLPVTCMDGRTENLPADCATTSRELCHLISLRLGLISPDLPPANKLINGGTPPRNTFPVFGFSLYVALFDKVSSLGDGDDHVMDAVSQCEQYAKETGAQEKNAPWRLFFRKEIFVPWREESDTTESPYNTSTVHVGLKPGAVIDLVYQQIVRGIKFGEYRCEKEEDLALVALQQYYVEHKKKLNNNSTVGELDRVHLLSALPSYIPDYYLQQEGSMEHWMKKVMGVYQSTTIFEQNVPAIRMKEEIVNYAKFKWPLLFSRFYEASLIASTNLSVSSESLPDILNSGIGHLRKNVDIIIAVNWTGFYVVDDQERVLLELSFPEIVRCQALSSSNQLSVLCISTAKQESMVFKCSGARDVSQLMNYFLGGLRYRSRYAIASTDFIESDPSFLSCLKGEIIQLDKPYGSYLKASINANNNNCDIYKVYNIYDSLNHHQSHGNNKSNKMWLSALSLSTQRKGEIPSNAVYVIPCLTCPDPDTSNLLATSIKAQSVNQSISDVDRMLSTLGCATLNNAVYRSATEFRRDAGGRDETVDTMDSVNANNRPHDLRRFALEHFRNREKIQAPKRSFGQTLSSTLSRKNPLKNFMSHISHNNPDPNTSSNINPPRSPPSPSQMIYQDNSNTSVTLSFNGNHHENNSGEECLWTHAKEPLISPLLKKLAGKDQLCHFACSISLSIAKYMGDQPLRRKLNYSHYHQPYSAVLSSPSLGYASNESPPLPLHSVDLTDQIFQPALKMEILRDEIYCQLIKQLTQNPNKTSEERGWELMWLATGCFPCSRLILPELTEFLRTSHCASSLNSPFNHNYRGLGDSSIALRRDCLLRLQKTLKVGPRKFPPHPVEVEAIQRKTTQIFHKVYFPDDTEQAFEVDSGTKATEFCFHISRRLGLITSQGFSLFVKIADKVISVPDQDFFFDFVRHLTDWIKRTCPNPNNLGTPSLSNMNNSSTIISLNSLNSSSQMGQQSQPALTYQIFFMRKLWLNVVPGVDRNADLIFHYHQEVPKYLRGYHKCNPEEAKILAALIYRVKYDCDSSSLTILSSFSKVAKDLIPSYMLSRQDHNSSVVMEDWRKGIAESYSQTVGLTPEEAKIEFLRRVYQWPTFGSAFFEVKQTTEPNLPDYLIIAINKNGLTLLDPITKETLSVFPFTQISNWSSGNTYFHITIGNLVQGSKLLCETSLGYKMDDLLTSYIGLMLSTMNKQRIKASTMNLNRL
ncbi:unnamed protein product [Gordionus sp. m RMFG-2023]|uniref:myosin-VIIa-like isoform X2 n=1 Tax=Gordionus sp. m RMFG-2023 TaxID=3053472 RepID=UPI0030E2F730